MLRKGGEQETNYQDSKLVHLTSSVNNQSNLPDQLIQILVIKVRILIGKVAAHRQDEVIRAEVLGLIVEVAYKVRQLFRKRIQHKGARVELNFE